MAVMAVAVLLLLQLVVHTLYMSANGRTGGQTDGRVTTTKLIMICLLVSKTV